MSAACGLDPGFVPVVLVKLSTVVSAPAGVILKTEPMFPAPPAPVVAQSSPLAATRKPPRDVMAAVPDVGGSAASTSGASVGVSENAVPQPFAPPAPIVVPKNFPSAVVVSLLTMGAAVQFERMETMPSAETRKIAPWLFSPPELAVP